MQQLQKPAQPPPSGRSAPAYFSRFKLDNVKGMPALVVIDMGVPPYEWAKSARPYAWANESGAHGLRKGLTKLASVVATARELEVPTVFFSYGHNSMYPNELTDAAAQEVLEITKYENSIFSSGLFLKEMERREVGTLVLAGFNMTCCVWYSLEGAAGLFRTVASGDLLFCTTPMPEILRSYEQIATVYLPQAEQVIKYLRAHVEAVRGRTAAGN
jgi:nicotinamidase-related amidase